MSLKWVLLLLVIPNLLHAAKKNKDHLSYSELVAKYTDLKKENHQDYPRSSRDEKEHFKNFKVTAKYIEDHNNNDGDKWTADFNAFSTMTEAERAMYTGLQNNTRLEKRYLGRRSSVKIAKRDNPTTVDYSDLLPSVKAQGSCGSCWAYAAVAPLEYQVNKDRSGDLLSLSEQQYLNCVYEDVDDKDGCSGGDTFKCWSWSKSNGGIASEASVPYTGSDGECDTSVANAITGFKVKGTRQIADGDEALENAIADSDIGVLQVAIAAVDSIYSYSSGVYSESDCTTINHAVAVVGYGVKDGVGYFRVRNSWDDWWGDQGYIDFERGLNGANINTCKISMGPKYPRVSGADATVSDNWCEYSDQYLRGYSTAGTGVYRFDTFAEAALECLDRGDSCGGITYETKVSAMYTLRKGSKLKTSKSSEVTWMDCDLFYYD